MKKQLAAVISLQKELNNLENESDFELMQRIEERDELIKMASAKLPVINNPNKTFSTFNKENELNLVWRNIKNSVASY